MNKPVAWIHELVEIPFDGYQITVAPDKGDYYTIPLYTHPEKELNNGGEPVKNATYWKRQYNLMATQNDNLKSGLYHANEQIKYLESHPVELTDEEILKLEEIEFENYCVDKESRGRKTATITDPEWAIWFAKAILRKASEK